MDINKILKQKLHKIKKSQLNAFLILKEKNLQQNQGKADGGALFVVTTCMSIICMSFAFVGGNMPSKFAKPNPNVVAAEIVTPAPAQSTLQLNWIKPKLAAVIPTIDPYAPALSYEKPCTTASGSAATDVMIIIDDSGSTTSSKGKISNAAGIFVDTLGQNPQNRVGTVLFSGTAILASGLTGNFGAVKQSINKTFQSEKGTCIKCGLEIANNEIAARGRPGVPKRAVLLSDGKANLPKPTDEAYRLTREQATRGYQQNRIALDTIGYSTVLIFNISNIDEGFMRELAGLTGGRYYSSPSDNELQNVFRQIATSIGSCN